LISKFALNFQPNEYTHLSNLHEYTSIIGLLDDARFDDDMELMEARALSTMVALNFALSEQKLAQIPRIVAEVGRTRMIPIANEANPNAIVIARDDVASMYLAQTIYEPEIGNVFEKLSVPNGFELLMIEKSVVINTDEQSASLSFLDLRMRSYRLGQTLLGYYSEEGKVVLNPKNEEKIDMRRVKTLITMTDVK